MIETDVILPCAAWSIARLSSAATLGLCAALLGCSDGSINMGEGLPVEVEQTPLPSSTTRCADSPVLEGNIVVHNQDEVDALEGCEVIDGDLYIQAFEGAHLRALHALTQVNGTLGIGSASTVELPHEPGAAERYLELNMAWLSSLVGLEALERAGSLTLIGLTSQDLEPLAQLRTLTEESLTIHSAPNLRSFNGLQNLVGVTSLDLSGVRALESFDGLTLPEYMLRLRIANANLQQLKPLGVIAVDDLNLFSNELRDLEAFSSLTYAVNITLTSNRSLESLAGLRNLTRVTRLVVEYNIAITEVPDFEHVTGLKELRFVVSPLLTRLPSFPSLLVQPAPSAPPLDLEQVLQLRPDVIQVYGMDALTKLRMPANLQSASLVRIELNSNLRNLEFTAQDYIQYLSITKNPLLQTVSTGALAQVSLLNLAENPLLPATSFDAVRRLDTTSEPGSGAP